MAWGNGGLFVQPWISTLKQTASQIHDFDAASTFNLALFNNSPVGSGSPPAMFVVTLANAVYNVGDWVSATNEVVGTGWSATGVTLASNNITESPSGTLMWSASNISVTSTTIPATGGPTIYGCLIYNSALATKYAVCGIPFSGGPYQTIAGTFGITWPSGGIFNIDITP